MTKVTSVRRLCYQEKKQILKKNLVTVKTKCIILIKGTIDKGIFTFD